MSKYSDSSILFRFGSFLKPWLFPLAIVALYGLGLLFAPAAAERALNISGLMFHQIALPLCLALIIMVLFNRFLSSATVTSFLGKKSGLKSVCFSSLAGIISMGPIYAWYPLFKSLKEKGASDFHVANFIACRSVKPVLFPVLVASFGWSFSALFVLLSLLCALIVACIVSLACSGSLGFWGGDVSD
ncbi:hypothetical protein [Maridesulfovibrio ferrireducens]|uniref:hypothetical protein n=1 Tax=Maridesulfovibrio ferrireducens TaxID=246191 RepID=UPI001A22560C|nr:hypothetical protein [Maridesulfovibrio ferrireducens]MBI9113090.1 hypothetical protein [Maridesulfovibrio ferrireducens]